VAIVDRLRGLADAPEEIEVEFGISSVPSSARSSPRPPATPNFHVSLRWKHGGDASV
jgi:hypothetical protein